MSDSGRTDDATQIERLTRELEEAELYIQKVRGFIAAIRDELAAGRTARAASMCNEALSEIDSATDVAAPSPRLKEWTELRGENGSPADERG